MTYILGNLHWKFFEVFLGHSKSKYAETSAYFFSSASEIKKTQHTLETWKVNFDSTRRQSRFWSYARSCLQYITEENLILFKTVQVLWWWNYHEWYNFRSQSLTKIFLWVERTEWAEYEASIYWKNLRCKHPDQWKRTKSVRHTNPTVQLMITYST